MGSAQDGILQCCGTTRCECPYRTYVSQNATCVGGSRDRTIVYRSSVLFVVSMDRDCCNDGPTNDRNTRHQKEPTNSMSAIRQSQSQRVLPPMRAFVVRLDDDNNNKTVYQEDNLSDPVVFSVVRVGPFRKERQSTVLERRGWYGWLA